MAKYTPGWRDRTHELLDWENAQRRAQLLKLTLPALIIVLMIIAFIWPQVKNLAYQKEPSLFQQRFKQNPELKNKAFGLIFKSLDKNHRPIEIHAEAATQTTPNITDFDKPSGQIYLEDGTWAKFWSDTGQHQKNENILDLKGNVRIVTQEGYDIITSSARVILNEQRGFGNERVHGTGPVGETITAGGFRLSHAQKNLTFTGKTKIVYPFQKDNGL